MRTATSLTVAEVAASLRTSRQTVYRLLDAEQLAGFRVGHQWRIHSASVEQYVTKSTTT